MEEWELERTVLLMSFIGYQWHYQDDPLEFLASELPFNLPLLDPRVGLPLSTAEVKVVGKIDLISSGGRGRYATSNARARAGASATNQIIGRSRRRIRRYQCMLWRCEIWSIRAATGSAC